MKAFGFLVLAACLFESCLAVTTKPCTCTRKYTSRHAIGTSTITGSASCTHLGIKPTCPTTTPAKVTPKAATTTKKTTTSCTPHPTGTGKRGLAYNDATLTKPFAVCGQSSKVSWAYNWYSGPYSANEPTSGFNPALKFIPMLWSSASDLTSVWNTNVAKAVSTYAADAVLAFNEPDGCGGGGSCMSVASAVSGYKTWVSPLRTKYPSLKLGAPAVTNGGSPMGLTYLNQFLGNCTTCNIDFIPIHWYGSATDITGFKNYVTSAYSATKQKHPLWITEFGTTSGTSAQVVTFLQTVLPWLDSLSYVSRYAWFMDAKGYLIDSNTGGLSQTGTIYNTY